MPQERARYAKLGGSEVDVGTGIASYDLVHTSWSAVAIRCRATAPSKSHHSKTSVRSPNVILSLECPKSVSSTRCLVALK